MARLIFYIFLGMLLSLIRIALVTLLERKLLAYSQVRLGPVKVLFKGVVQPLLDGIKLLQKGLLKPVYSLKELLVFRPLLLFVGMVIAWSCVISFPFHSIYWLGLLFLVLVLRLGVYSVLLAGFAGASKYSLVGGMRACSQRISYEVALALLLFSVLFLEKHQRFFVWRRFLLFIILPLWFLSYIAETNRAPFDLAEGERELIRGFNLEFAGLLFAYVLVGEYGIVICLSFLTAIIFLRRGVLLVGLFLLLRLMLRRTLPRLRYDKLISFCWTKILPVSIFLCIFQVVYRV